MAYQDTISGQDFGTQKGSTMLRRTLWANDIFTAVMGLLFLFFSKQVAAFLGTPYSNAILFLGIGLLAWAGFMAWIAMPTKPNSTLAMVIIESDVLWVAGTILLLVFAGGMFTTEGKWAMAIVGDIVATFAILQWIGLRRIQRG